MQGPLCIWPCSRPAMSILSSTRHACPTKDLDQLIACPPLHTMRRPLCRRWVQQRSPTPPIPSFQPSATISTILQYDIIIPTRNYLIIPYHLNYHDGTGLYGTRYYTHYTVLYCIYLGYVTITSYCSKTQGGAGRERGDTVTQNADQGRATPHTGTNPHTGQNGGLLYLEAR